jgi:hypothetical protein
MARIVEVRAIRSQHGERDLFELHGAPGFVQESELGLELLVMLDFGRG